MSQCTLQVKRWGRGTSQELTETPFVTFFNGNARDRALKLLEAKYSKYDDKGLSVAANILCTTLVAARTRFKVQKSRNWVFHKALEIQGANIEFDWTMPIRRISVNGDPACLQPKESLHGTFVCAKFVSL